MQRRLFLKSMTTAALTPWVWQGRASGASPELLPPREESDFCRRLEPLGRILELEDYYVWCNTPIMGDDGKVHVFYSRWPRKRGMGGWLNSSEIAHAVADQPAGPYETTDIALAPRGRGHWDATTCHNPHIQKIDGQYCLFYMGNSNGKTNTKRAGLATAETLSGPWQRQDHPLLEPGPEGAWDDHCTTNPSYIRHPNGESWLYYKSWNTADYVNDSPPIRGNRKYGLAIAADFDGPYTRHPDNPLVDFSALGDNRQCEDAYVWREGDTFKMIARDMGVFGHEVGLYMESRDGLRWSSPKLAFHELSHYIEQPPAPRHLKRYGRLERPQLLFQDGRPTHLFGASQGGRFSSSSGFVFALKAK